MTDNMKVTMEVEVEDLQEAIHTIAATNKKIAWILENRPPFKQREFDELKYRNAHLTLIELRFTKVLHDRALAEQNVTQIGGKNDVRRKA